MTEARRADVELGEMTRLMARYATAIDTGRWAEFAAVFAEDGVLVVRGHETRGRAELEAFAERSPRGVHLSGPPLLDADRSTAAFTFVSAETGQLVAGHYRDVLTREDGRLVLQRREIDLVARTP